MRAALSLALAPPELLREESVVLGAVLVPTDGVPRRHKVLAAIVDDELELLALLDRDVGLEALGLGVIAARNPLLPWLSCELAEHLHAPFWMWLFFVLPRL